MDRIGFNLIDAEYQKDLKAQTMKIIEELDMKYLTKERGTVPREMQRDGREADKQNRKLEFQKRIAEVEKILDRAHFPETGRSGMLKQVEHNEKVEQYDKRMKEHLEKGAQEKEADMGR